MKFNKIEKIILFVVIILLLIPIITVFCVDDIDFVLPVIGTCFLLIPISSILIAMSPEIFERSKLHHEKEKLVPIIVKKKKKLPIYRPTIADNCNNSNARIFIILFSYG